MNTWNLNCLILKIGERRANANEYSVDQDIRIESIRAFRFGQISANEVDRDFLMGAISTDWV